MADPIPPQQPQAVFVNVARVRHTAAEFYLDLAQLLPDQPGAAGLVSSVVMTPQHTKLLLRVLEDNIAKFEAKHGEIELPVASPTEEIQ